MHRYCHSLGVHFVDKNATDWHLDLGCVLSWFQTITLDQSPFGLLSSQFLLDQLSVGVSLFDVNSNN